MTENGRDYWRPQVGEMVWMNYPDHDEPEGRVVGYTQDFGSQEGDHRYDQPVILGPERAAILGPERGMRPPANEKRLFVIHPMFLLPFPYGGPEWKQADAEGRVG